MISGTHILTDEYVTFNLLGIVPRDEQNLWRPTIPIIDNLADFLMISKMEFLKCCHLTQILHINYYIKSTHYLKFWLWNKTKSFSQ